MRVISYTDRNGKAYRLGQPWPGKTATGNKKVPTITEIDLVPPEADQTYDVVVVGRAEGVAGAIVGHLWDSGAVLEMLYSADDLANLDQAAQELSDEGDEEGAPEAPPDVTQPTDEAVAEGAAPIEPAPAAEGGFA